MKKIFFILVFFNFINTNSFIVNLQVNSTIPSYSPSFFYLPPTTRKPTKNSVQPSYKPSVLPSGNPSILPSVLPTIQPSCLPSVQPSVKPTGTSSGTPSSISYNTYSNTNTLNPSITTLSIIPTKDSNNSSINISNSVYLISQNLQYIIVSILGCILIILSVFVFRCFFLRFTNYSNLEKFNENNKLKIDIDLSDIVGSNDVNIDYEKMSPSKVRLLIGMNSLTIPKMTQFKPIITPTSFMKTNYYPRMKFNNAVAPLTENLDWLTDEREEKNDDERDSSYLSYDYKTDDVTTPYEPSSPNHSILNKLFLSVNRDSKCLNNENSIEDTNYNIENELQHQQQLQYFIPPQTHTLLSNNKMVTPNYKNPIYDS